MPSIKLFQKTWCFIDDKEEGKEVAWNNAKSSADVGLIRSGYNFLVLNNNFPVIVEPFKS